VKDNYYFDNAATTWPKPEPVYQFMDRFFRSHGVNPGRSGSQLAVEAEQMIVETRSLLAQFFGFGGDPARVVFTLNATDSLNIAIRGLVDAGDHVIISQLEHNAVLRTTNHLERDFGVAVSRVGHGEEGYLDLAALASAVQPNTKAIVLNHASNVLGTVQDLAAVGELARSCGACFIVDTAQTAGVVPIDMQRDGIGVLTFTGHKGLFGPMGVGGMIVAEDVELRAPRFGGTGVNSESPFQPDGYPHRLEAGTLSMPGVAGLHAAQKWFAELGAKQLGAEGDHKALCTAAIHHIHDTEMEHVNRIAAGLAQIDKVHLLGSQAEGQARVSTLSFLVDGTPAQQMSEMLDADYHISVRAGLHCAPLVHKSFQTIAAGGAVRVSPGYFTEAADVDHLLEAIGDLI
jgi:cysteine desulfurase family protein